VIQFSFFFEWRHSFFGRNKPIEQRKQPNLKFYGSPPIFQSTKVSIKMTRAITNIIFIIQQN
jgi:hypothetical protein